MQLDACIRSIERSAPYAGPIVVVYRTTTPEAADAYRMLDLSGRVRLVAQSEDFRWALSIPGEITPLSTPTVAHKVFNERGNEVKATGNPATLYFEFVDEAVSAMAVADTLASHTQTAGTATKSEAEPAAVTRATTYAGKTWTETSGSPKAVRMMTSARCGGGKLIAAWDIDDGNAVNLATAAPLTVNLADKLAYDGEP